MARSRAEDVLEGWRMVTRQAVKAERAPRRTAHRPSLSMGFAVAAVALVLVVGFALRAEMPLPPRSSELASQPVNQCGAPPARASLACTEPPAVCGSAPPRASLACASAAPTGAPGGLSREEATVVALRLAPSSARTPSVIWASIESDPFALGATTRPRVWEVRLEAPFAASPCPSGFLERIPSTSDPACLDAQSGLVVVLDYFTGDLIGWMH